MIQAVSENTVEKESSKNNGSGNGREGTHNREPSTGLLAVHGGERAGRPRVSGW